MPDRDSHQPGVPCWVDHSSSDPERAADFYHELFGWDVEDQLPPEVSSRYFMCRLRGRDVAAIGSQQGDAAPAMWNVYIAVADADETARKVRAAGGTVIGDPFDVFEAGRMALLRDQAGASLCLWQPRRNPGAETVGEPGTLIWNELTTRDPDGSRRFYGAVFGWTGSTADYEGVEYTFWQLGEGAAGEGPGIAGMMPMTGDAWPADLPPHWMTYFAVADTDATCETCTRLGGGVAVPAFDTATGRIAVLNDPLGAVFSVLQPPA